MPPGKTPRIRAAILVFVAVALTCAVGPVWAVSASSETSPGLGVRQTLRSTAGTRAYVPGEAIVRFAPSASTADRRAARAEADVELEESVGLPHTQLVDVDGLVPAAIRRLEAQPGVAYAQPNYRYEASAISPDDTFFGELWGLSDPVLPDPGLSALDAWETTKGSEEVIAVLDTGVDLTHPDLAGNLWENPSPDPVDEDLHGFDFVNDDGNPDDFNFHGTHVAGTAAAIADNTQGIAGVAPEAQIMAVRVLDGNGSGSTVEIAEGIKYAADHGADVINMSLGGLAGGGDKAMADAIAAAPNVVVVVAAGNEAADNEVEPESPCVLPQANLICVAALNRSGSLAGFSNYGAKSVDLAAPGTSILSSKPDYGVPVFEDGFEVAPGPWSTTASGGGLLWDRTKATAANGEFSAADSPTGDYGHSAPGAEEPAASELFTTEPVSLAGERGCRVHFNTKYEIESGFDVFVAGAVSESSPFAVVEFDGASFGFPSSFIREEASVSSLDGRTDVHPFFGVFSDEEAEFDGAYVDDVRLFCRDETYLDAIATGSTYDQPESGSYVRFQGTSMATPHVAGEVALVRAAAPTLNAQEVVKAILDGTSAIPIVTTGKRTATEGIADACKAVAIATGGNVATQCPASSEPTPQRPPGPSVQEIEEQIVNASPPASPETMEQVLRRRIPQTFLRRHPVAVLHIERGAARAVFRFAADESGATFLCKFDRAAFRTCRRKIVWHAELGPHVLRVKARDADGNVDPSPAVFRFRVERVG
jgi:thermitase